MVWVLEAHSAGDGLGFPFDQPHLTFYQRLRETYPSLKALKAKGVSILPLVALHRALADVALKNLVTRSSAKSSSLTNYERRCVLPVQAEPRGSTTKATGNIKTIESRVKAFRDSEAIKALSANDTSYHKMVKQIDKYWGQTLCRSDCGRYPCRYGNDPATADQQSDGAVVSLSQTRWAKEERAKGVSKILVAMLADTPLVRNLDNPDYMKILLNGKDSLAARFADIDIEQVRQEEQQNTNRFRKYPKNMRRLFRVPHLPRKIMKLASM